MLGFKKQQTIEFFSVMPDVARIAPIQLASNFRPPFMDKAAKELSALKKDPRFGTERVISTAKCPGIYDYYKHGFVMTTWQDIVITTNGDMESVNWRSAVDQTQMEGGSLAGEAVELHTPAQYSNFRDPDDTTLKTVIKLNTPWRCVVPEGYYLQESGLPYTEEKRFTTVSGFFSREYGVSFLNVQLLWHVLDGEVLIKAGTPIAHYMLIPKDQPKLVVRSATRDDVQLEKNTKLELAKRFVTNRSDQKCIFAKMFGK